MSQSKGNQSMEFGQLIEYNKRNIFFQKSCRKLAWETSSDLFLFYEKALYEVKVRGLQFSFNVFRWP